MGKRGLILLSLVLFLSLSGAESYTVVLKSGKTLEGTFISETVSSIIFKDASGSQLSLKKSTLDLVKMGELNAASPDPTKPPAPPVPASPPKKSQAPKQNVKIFTNADLPGAAPNPEENINDQPVPPSEPVPTPETPAATPVPAESAKPASSAVPVVPPKSAVSTNKDGKKVFTNEDVVPAPPRTETAPAEPSPAQPAPQTAQAIAVDANSFDKDLTDGAGQLSKTLQDLSALSDGIAANWEVAASTGNDPKRSVRDYMSGATANAILGNVTQQINALQALQGKLVNVPAGREQSYQIFSRAVDALKTFHSQIQDYDSIQNVNLLKSRLTELSSQINSAVGVLLSAENSQKKE
jgi:hypothetical protein